MTRILLLSLPSGIGERLLSELVSVATGLGRDDDSPLAATNLHREGGELATAMNGLCRPTTGVGRGEGSPLEPAAVRVPCA